MALEPLGLALRLMTQCPWLRLRETIQSHCHYARKRRHHGCFVRNGSRRWRHQGGRLARRQHRGFDPSSATRGLHGQTVRENGIFLGLSDAEPNAESLASIREADALIAAGGPGYGSAAAMFASMGL